MSDAPNPQDHLEIVALANQYKRLQRELEAKTSQLEALTRVNAEAGEFPVDFEGARPRRYSIDFLFNPIASSSVSFSVQEVPAQEKDVTVQAGTIFRCAKVESFVRAVGTTEAGLSAQVTLPWSDRVRAFDFLWRIRDSGRDREWNNRLLPALFLGGGYFGPLWLPRRTIIGGGTVISAYVEPFVSGGGTAGGNTAYFPSGATLQQFALQISFDGHEVPDTERV